MVVSFKIQKKGRRYRSKPRSSSEAFHGQISDKSTSSLQAPTFKGRKQSSDDDIRISCSSTYAVPEDHQTSFTLSLYPDGYSIENPQENRCTDKPDHHEVMRPSLRQYNKASQTLFKEIESGLFPVEISEEIPCKYIDGTIVCEVRDYRDCAAQQDSSSQISCPVINRVRLNMSFANVVKDLPSIADDSWTYSDFLEVESRILKALNPKLYLDPAPNLDRLCRNTQLLKLNSIRRTRPSRVPVVFEGAWEEPENGDLGNKLGFKPSTLSNKTMHQSGVGSSIRSILGYLGKRETQDRQMVRTSRSSEMPRTFSHPVQQQHQQETLDGHLLEDLVRERSAIDHTARGDIAEHSYFNKTSDTPDSTREFLLRQESLFLKNPDPFLPAKQVFHQQKLPQLNEYRQFHQNQQSLISNREPNQTKLMNDLQHLRTTTGQCSQPSSVIMGIVERQCQLQQQEQNQMMMLRLERSIGCNAGSNIDVSANGNSMSRMGVSEIIPPVSGFSSNIDQFNLSSSFGSGMLGHKQARLDCSTGCHKPGINYLELAAQKVVMEPAKWNQQQQQKQQSNCSNNNGNSSNLLLK